MTRQGSLAAAALAAGCISARAPYMDGLAYERRHQVPQAIAAYHEALSMNPDFAPAHRRLAVLLRERDPAAAAEHRERAMTLDPAAPDPAAQTPPSDRSPPIPADRRIRLAADQARVEDLLSLGDVDGALRFLEDRVRADSQACWAYVRLQALRSHRGDEAGTARARAALSACRSGRAPSPKTPTSVGARGPHRGPPDF